MPPELPVSEWASRRYCACSVLQGPSFDVVCDVAHADRVAVARRPGNTDPQRFTSLINGLEARGFGTLADGTWVYSGHGPTPPSAPVSLAARVARAAGEDQSHTAGGRPLQIGVHKLQAGHSGDLAEVLEIARDHMNG